MIDSSFDDRDSACTMQLLVKAGGDSDSMARLTDFVSMLQQSNYQARFINYLAMAKSLLPVHPL